MTEPVTGIRPKLPLFVRKMATSETSMVMTNWKRSLLEKMRKERRWGHGMREWEFWALANHVIDKISFPSCTIYVGCHPNEPAVPICWAAVRKREGAGYEVAYLYARDRVLDDAELAAGVQTELLSEVRRLLPVIGPPIAFDLYKELTR